MAPIIEAKTPRVISIQGSKFILPEITNAFTINAPPVIPNNCGSPNGFRVVTCIIDPDNASNAPIVIAINILGILISQTIVDCGEFPLLKIASFKSVKDKFVGPNKTPIKKPNITNISKNKLI